MQNNLVTQKARRNALAPPDPHPRTEGGGTQFPGLAGPWVLGDDYQPDLAEEQFVTPGLGRTACVV